jgi:hypothetical protein
MTIDVGSRIAAAGVSAISGGTRKLLFVIALLILIGVSFAALWPLRGEQDACGSLTIGASAVGGCDWIGRPRWALLTILRRTGLMD